MYENGITKVDNKEVDTGCVIIGVFGIILLLALAAAAIKDDKNEERKKVFDEMSKDYGLD